MMDRPTQEQELGYLCHALDSTAERLIENISALCDEDRQTIQSVIARLQSQMTGGNNA